MWAVQLGYPIRQPQVIAIPGDLQHTIIKTIFLLSFTKQFFISSFKDYDAVHIELLAKQ